MQHYAAISIFKEYTYTLELKIKDIHEQYLGPNLKKKKKNSTTKT